MRRLLFFHLRRRNKNDCPERAIQCFAGKVGHHHVNCRDSIYWEKVFNEYGFELDLSLTLGARGSSTMKRNFFRENGLVFINKYK